MKKLLLITAFLLSGGGLYAQDDRALRQSRVNTDAAAAHIWFLAADELRGRETGSPEIDIAAAYIAAQYRRYGVQPFNGSYYQNVALERVGPAEKGSFAVNGQVFEQGKALLVMQAVNLSAQTGVVFVGYGLPEDMDKKEIAGKIVVARAGYAPDDTPQQMFRARREKNKNARVRGAVALVELYASQTLPWKTLVGYLSGSRLGLASEAADEIKLGHIWLADPGGKLALKFSTAKKLTGTIALAERQRAPLPARNVIGVVEGSDPQLKDEYILLSAHYDHIGVKHNTHGEDSIYNGARDNAIGVAAILAAAESLQNLPVKRSVLFLACTGEEKGLLGSKWYAENPPVPLHKIVYNLNIDGGGYNDVTKVSVMGLTRTTAEKEIREAIRAFGLEPLADPAPEENLFDRSDNVSFAARGIPAPTFSTGFTAFDEEILKYYHQVTDEAASLDFAYLAQYFKAYAYVVRSIANRKETPFWVPGDKYEAAGKKLYGRE